MLRQKKPIDFKNVFPIPSLIISIHFVLDSYKLDWGAEQQEQTTRSNIKYLANSFFFFFLAALCLCSFDLNKKQIVFYSVLYCNFLW